MECDRPIRITGSYLSRSRADRSWNRAQTLAALSKNVKKQQEVSDLGSRRHISITFGRTRPLCSPELDDVTVRGRKMKLNISRPIISLFGSQEEIGHIVKVGLNPRKSRRVISISMWVTSITWRVISITTIF